jgi:hypothetical protein
MSTKDFSVLCKVCGKEVDGFIQNIRFILTEEESVQERESVALSCGCVVDFPDWQVNTVTGICSIHDFAGTMYIEFYDKEMLLFEGDE